MAKYHINPKGDVSKCSALTGRCPFADDADHYLTADGARIAYERKQESLNNAPISFSLTKKTSNAPTGFLIEEKNNE